MAPGGAHNTVNVAAFSARNIPYVSAFGPSQCHVVDMGAVDDEGASSSPRRYMPDLIDLVLGGTIDPSKVFNQTLPLEQVADGCRAMDERRAIKTLQVP